MGSRTNGEGQKETVRCENIWLWKEIELESEGWRRQGARSGWKARTYRWELSDSGPRNEEMRCTMGAMCEQGCGLLM